MKLEKRIGKFLKDRDFTDSWNKEHPEVKIPLPNLKQLVIKPIAKTIAKATGMAFCRYGSKGAGFISLFFGKGDVRQLKIDVEVNTENQVVYVLEDDTEVPRYKLNSIGASVGMNRKRVTFQKHFDESTIADYITKNKNKFLR